MDGHTLSVVIPSIGGDLSNTLESINAGSVIPDEIIVCLPNNSHSVKDVSKYKNLTIVYADRYGQVYQRIVGLKHAKGDYILQLDSDMLLDSQCLERLIISLKELPLKSTISPCMFDNNGEPLYQKKRTGFLSIYYRIVNGKNGYQPGALTLAGTNYGVNPNEVDEDILKVDWQAGGCVLHRRNNLILEDYYPNKGKAYCEDLIHSFLLRSSGIELFVDIRAKCSTTLDAELLSINEIVPDFKARLHLVRLAKLSTTRMLIRYIVYIMRFFRF